MKKVALFMALCILTQNVTYAYVVREADIKSEKIIPFSFISEDSYCEEGINIKGLNDVKIEKIYVDNGDLDAYINGNYICLDFSNGKKSNSLQTVTKTDILEIKDMPLMDDKNMIIEVKSDKNINEITEVTGDFESASVKSRGNIEIKVNRNADGIQGYDESKTEISQMTVKVDSDNRLRKIDSEYINLEHEIIGDIKVVSGDTSAVEDIIIKDKTLKVIFNNGIPKLNETTVNDGHTYFWIDRESDGIFKKYNPNSIYTTDRNRISGIGEYLDESEKDELGMTLTHSKWTDYCGAEINGVRYIYPFDKEKGIPDELNGEILLGDTVKVDGQAFNTEKYTVEFSKSGVSYIPEGKLYSMGELVSGTSGWGEVCENKEWESKETFFNDITGKLETYVKHYKFYYGPKNKKAFGGFYTYPYSCTLQYEHYKPVKLYSGEVVYTYDCEEYVRGYLYNGWIKISYTENKTVNDYPPTSPYNIKYDFKNNVISWEHGADDYTQENELSYEIQVYTGSWGNIIKSETGKNSVGQVINYSNYDVRVRTVDEVNQVSEWAKLSDNAITLNGKVAPNVIKAGDPVKIYANTKSLSKISKVSAKSDALGIDCELYKISEKKPEYFEMSYDIVADFLEEDEYIYTDNGRCVKSNKGEYENYAFRSSDKTNRAKLEILIPEDIPFSKNGTVVIPNGNYLNSPLNIFNYDNKKLYLHMTNEIGIRNKVNGKTECFVAFENAGDRVYQNYRTTVNFVPRLVINSFEYDDTGNPKYVKVEVARNIADKPIVIRWNTDVYGVTRIDISIEDKDIYSYKINYSKIEKYVSNIEYEKIEKYLKKYALATYGYIYPSKKFDADWAKIVLKVPYRYNIQEFPWLGYRVRKNEYVRDEYIINYNNNPAVRNTYRTLILDEYASDTAIKKYINLIKNTNFPIEKDGGKTVFADDVLDYNCEFELENIITNSKVLPGKYEIELTAIDVDEKSNKIMLTVIVESDEKQMYPEEEENYKVKDILIGRFFYKDGQGYMEELKKHDKNLDVEGFISAGETICVNFIADNVEFLDIDFLGDDSIKTLDPLTRLFLIEKPEANGKNVENITLEYNKFPKRIYPVNINSDGESEFRYFYTIPYKTIQSIHSWSTLKNSTLEEIEAEKLFNRMRLPYKLKVTVNGDENNSYEIPFDVFERWDTIINRDVSEFITNSNTKWEIRIDK